MGDHDEYDRDHDDMSLEELREEIAEIDRDIVDLIARRTYVAHTIADVKAARGLETTDAGQEERVMARALDWADRFDLDREIVASIFEQLIELNKVEQRESR